MNAKTLLAFIALAPVLPAQDPTPPAILLITADSLHKAWQPFADWKTQIGKPCKIVTVETIAKSKKGPNIQEKIRLCVREHIEKHQTKWIILGGDCMPGGKGLVPGGHTTVHRQEPRGIPTDIVYLSSTNWDADGDGIYGEFRDDKKAIQYPDGSVGLGRIPVRTAADVAAFTAKVIAFESNYPTTPFATKMIYTCTDKPAYAKVRRSWDGFVSKAWEQGEVGRFFSTETPWDKDGEPGSYALSNDNLVGLINAKSTGKLHIHGHGHLPAWVLERSRFTGKDVAKLENTGAYPLITTVSCNTGEYDSRKDPSIVEAILRKPGGGSVAVVAPVRTGKPHFHSRRDFMLMMRDGKLDGTTQTMTRYWSYGLGSNATTGVALMKAKADMVSDAAKTAGYHLCICELNLLGDPTLDMRARQPKAPKLKLPEHIAVGAQAIQVETDAPGATVCVQMGDALYATATTDAKGAATLRIAPIAKGSLTVTVSGPSLNATSKQVPVQ